MDGSKKKADKEAGNVQVESGPGRPWPGQRRHGRGRLGRKHGYVNSIERINGKAEISQSVVVCCDVS